MSIPSIAFLMGLYLALLVGAAWWSSRHAPKSPGHGRPCGC
jgi:hypothetical protein